MPEYANQNVIAGVEDNDAVNVKQIERCKSCILIQK